MINSCAAIVIAAKHGELTKVKDASGIAYTVGTLRCKFNFRTNDWDYTTRTAVFCKGNVSTHPQVVNTAIGVKLDGVDECAVPPEVLLPDEKYFSVGVWGVTNDGLRIVSEWLVFRIKDGCYVDSTESFLPTPSVYEQVLMSLNSKAPIEHKHEEYVTEEELASKNYVSEAVVEDIVKECVKEADIPDSLSDLSEDATHRTVTDAEKQAWNNKVDKVAGKGLSTNDYTNEEKEKVAQLSSGAIGGVQSDWNQTDATKLDYINNKPFGEEPKIELASWNANTVSNDSFTVKIKYAGIMTKTVGTYKKVSDISIAVEDFLKSELKVNGVTEQINVDFLEEGTNCYLYNYQNRTISGTPSMTFSVPQLIIVTSDNVDMNTDFSPGAGYTASGAIAKSAGIYIFSDAPALYNADVTIQKGGIKQLDEKFIPETIARANAFAPVAFSGNLSDLIINWDTQLIFDGGDADVQLAVLDETILQ